MLILEITIVDLKPRPVSRIADPQIPGLDKTIFLSTLTFRVCDLDLHVRC
jgi:hypothetical protein